MFPVRHTTFVEIFDGIDVIIAYHYIAWFALAVNLAQVFGISHGRHTAFAAGDHILRVRKQFAAADKWLLHVIVATYTQVFVGRIVAGQIGISPVDTHAISFTFHVRLVDGTRFEIIHAVFADLFGNCWLWRFVYGELRGRFDINLYVVLFLIEWTYAIRNVVDGSWDQIEILHQQGSGKYKVQFYRSAGECIVSLGR